MVATTTELHSTLSQLSTKELFAIERFIHTIYRKRNVEAIYDDAYGVWTEEDQVSLVAESFALFDQEEKEAEDAIA